MFLCKECLTCGSDFHMSASVGPCESCQRQTTTADCHHESSGAFESLTAEKKRLELEKERKEDVVEYLHSREGEFITEDDLIELARIPILGDGIRRLQRRLDEVVKFQSVRATKIRELQKELAKAEKGLRRADECIVEFEKATSGLPKALEMQKQFAEANEGYDKLEENFWSVVRSTGVTEGKFQQQVKVLIKALEKIAEPEDGLDYLDLVRISRTRRQIAKAALATSSAPTTPDRCETCGRVAPLHWEKSHWKCPVPTTSSAAKVNDSKWCSTCKLYHGPDATSWNHAVKKSELKEGYQNSEQTAGLMKWCENCHGYHDPNGPHPTGSAR